MSEKLKPCPFCGSEARIWQNEDGTGSYYGRCKRQRCAATGPWAFDADVAAHFWNTRKDASHE